ANAIPTRSASAIARNLKEEPRHQESAELIEQQKRFVIFGRMKPPVRGGTVPTMNGHGNQAEAGDRIAETETSSSSICERSRVSFRINSWAIPSKSGRRFVNIVFARR